MRAFKTTIFSRAARKAQITDDALCKAIREMTEGKADNLGGGVFKKRLGRNLYRSIILARGGQFWVYEFLFAKNDRSNISNAELTAFRLLAKSYAALTPKQLGDLLAAKHFTEICHDHA